VKSNSLLAIKRVASFEKNRKQNNSFNHGKRRQLMDIDGEVVEVMTNFKKSVLSRD
jgi:hypothetical protein